MARSENKRSEKKALHIRKAKEFIYAHKIFFGVLAAFAIYYMYLYSQLQYPAGPIYGGDAYLHFGTSNHLADGGSFFESSHYKGEYNHYPNLSQLIMVIISKITFQDMISSSIIFALLVNLAGGWMYYLIGRKLFDNHLYAALLSILGFLPMYSYVGPTAASMKIFLPMILLLFLYIEEKKMMVWIGILFGLASLAHIITFLTLNLMLASWFASKLIFSGKKMMESAKEGLSRAIPIFLISFTISMLYWAPIFIKYHAKTLNSWQEYGASGIAGMLPSFLSLLKIFVSTVNYSFLFPIFAIIGMLYVLKGYRKEKNRIILLFFLTFIIGYLHPIITIPLLGTSFGYYGFGQLIGVLQAVFVIYGAYVLIELVKNFKEYKTYLLLILAIQMLVFGVYAAEVKDPWFISATQKNEFMDAEFRMAEFIKKNTDVNDVILTPHGETSFSVNGITGRKIVSMRRTHASPFVDANKREADTAVMLYGKDNETIARLLSNYDVKFLFLDPYAMDQIQKCNQAWTYLDDPQYHEASYSCLRTSLDHEKYLNDNGIETKKVYVRQDVASDTAPKAYLLAIKPDFVNLSIKDRLALAHQEMSGNQPMLMLFQIMR